MRFVIIENVATFISSFHVIGLVVLIIKTIHMATPSKNKSEQVSAVEETAKMFLHGLLANISHLHLDKTKIKDLVDKSFDIAEAFHAKQG